MGYEKAMTLTIVSMLLENKYRSRIPSGPRPLKRQLSEDPAYGGTPNHELLARVARVIYSCDQGTSDADREIRGLRLFFENQIEHGFMTRGTANEQMSPSHTSWWLTGVLALRWWLFLAGNLKWWSQLTGQWLSHHHALCRLFATPENTIVAPGARAWPLPSPDSTKPYYGRSKSRDELYAAIERGNVKRTWPSTSLDMLALTFANRLLRSGDDLGGAKDAKSLPLLRWPISYQRDDSGNFTGYLTTIEGNSNLTTQRLAVYESGNETYGFDDADERILEGSERKIIGLDERRQG